MTTDAQWQAELSSIVDRCARQWGLAVGERLTGGLVGHVFACTTSSGQAAVLKLVPPSAAAYCGPASHEAAALEIWAGRGAVRLLAFDQELDALLTERALPGVQLQPGDETRARREVAAVMSRLFTAEAPPAEFRHQRDVVDNYLRNKATLPDASPRLPLQVARDAARRLADEAAETALLHGDLMDKNLLWCEDRLVVIDPMPCVGDPHADIGFWAATRQPVGTIDERAADLAAMVGLDPDRAARWAAVYAVGQACEAWRSDARELQQWANTRARVLLEEA